MKFSFVIKTLVVFLFDFLNATMSFITFWSENSQISKEIVNSRAAESTKIIKILDPFRNADIGKLFC